MSRNIWVEIPEKSKLQLSSAGCREYKQRAEKMSNECYEAGKIAQDDCFALTPNEKKLEKFFNELSKADQNALIMEMEIEEMNENIFSVIRSIWNSNKWSSSIYDVESENKYIEAMRKKYVYPDMMDVIGPASDEDFIESINYFTSQPTQDLTTERKADLLLLGVFRWNNLYIAKADKTNEQALRGWQICIDPVYVPTNILGARYLKGRTLRNQMVFMPFHGVKSSWLSAYFLECDAELGNRKPKGKYQRLQYIDGNPYNCLPENLALVENRGRRMKCYLCEQSVTATTSKVIRDGPTKFRYCLSCLGEI